MNREDIIKRLRSLDYNKVEDTIISFMKKEANDNNKDMFIVGLSGGLDSSVVAKLASLSGIKTLGLIMPYLNVTPNEDISDAISLARECNIDYLIISLDSIYEHILTKLPKNKYAAGNLLARLRMCILYYYANVNNGLVLGTSDKSELLIGYFTKYGDGAADLLPIASLYKLQVREFASMLGIKDRIVSKRSSPRLWRGHVAEEELGMVYEDIDGILYSIFDLRLSIEEVMKTFGEDKVKKVMDMYKNTSHKRNLPKLCII